MFTMGLSTHQGLSGRVLQSEDLPLDRRWKIHKYEMVFVIQIILATLIDDSDQIILGRSRIGENPVDFASD